jgi:hypothetical protein
MSYDDETENIPRRILSAPPSCFWMRQVRIDGGPQRRCGVKRVD